MTPVIAAPRAAVVAMATGCVLLVARPALVTRGPAVLVLAGIFLALLLVGAAWPSAGTERARDVGWTLAIGLGAFVVARVLGGGHPPHAPVARLLVLNSFAAVAEEAFFRRFVYRLLEPTNAALAVAGSASLFAIVHVTVYGMWVLPIDLAAGLVLSWQRLASGTWRVPAVTHVLANVLVVI